MKELRKRNMFLYFAVLLLAIFTFVCLDPAAGKAITQAGDTDKPVHNETQSTYYDTIIEAVASADAEDIISVSAGTYTESPDIIIGKSMTLKGTGSDSSIINGGNEGVVITILNTDNVTISGFRITGSGTTSNDAGIGLIYASSCDIKDNVIDVSGVAGIALIGSSNNTIEGNTSTSSKGYGIVLDNSSGMEPSGITAANGVVANSTNNEITGNTLSYNAVNGIYLGENCNSNMITENTVEKSGADGIYIWKSAGNTVVDNDSQYNSGVGIHLMASQNNTIVGNNIHYNNRGILIRSGYGYIGESWLPLPSTGNCIAFNNISGNSDYGLYRDVSDAYSDDLFAFDATDNWWGDSDGPFVIGENEETSGDIVSCDFGTAYVVYSPWMRALKDQADGATSSDDVSFDITLTDDEENIIAIVEVETSHDEGETVTVAIAKFDTNPASEDLDGTLLFDGAYYDLKIISDDVGKITSISLKLKLPDGYSGTPLPKYYDTETGWIAFDDDTFEVSGGYLIITLTADSMPSISDFSGTVLAVTKESGGGSSSGCSLSVAGPVFLILLIPLLMLSKSKT